MVLPLYDDNTGRRLTPFVNYTFIAINVFVFVVLQQGGHEHNKFTWAWSTVPAEIVTGQDLEGPQRVGINPITNEPLEIDLEHTPISVYLTLLTSMFMHGSWMHLAGNMLFLWIFGDNVEDYLGHVRYLLFYIFCGVAASLCHIATTYAIPDALRVVPSLGASGAISGVLGGYVLLYPHRWVMVLLFRFLTRVPAWVAIGVWFVFQLISSVAMVSEPTGGGVAYGAHIGGFIVGLATVKLFTLGMQTDNYRGPPTGQSYGRQLPRDRYRR